MSTNDIKLCPVKKEDL